MTDLAICSYTYLLTLQRSNGHQTEQVSRPDDDQEVARESAIDGKDDVDDVKKPDFEDAETDSLVQNDGADETEVVGSGCQQRARALLVSACTGICCCCSPRSDQVNPDDPDGDANSLDRKRAKVWCTDVPALVVFLLTN